MPFLSPVTNLDVALRGSVCHDPHLFPVRCRYSYRVTAEPPLLLGARHLRVTRLSPGVAVRLVIADGALKRKVAVAVFDTGAVKFLALTALIWKLYVLPFATRMVWEVPVPVSLIHLPVPCLYS